MKKAVFLSSSAIVIGFGLVSASPAVAQDATGNPAQAAGSAPTSVDAGDIIVTGQKRAERLQDVPKQVSVVSQTQLQQAGVSRLTDLAAAVPAISAQPQNQTPKAPGIRGIAPVAYSIGVQSQTGIIVDDIPQSTFSTLAYNLQDVERLEVFAGPQSTLSGRNATGGIINFVTRAPSSTPEYDVSLAQTTDRQTKATVFLTGPLTSNLAYSLSGIFDKWDGNLRNVLRNGQYVEGYNTKGVRGKLRWEPTDRLTATLSGYYLYTHRLQSPLLTGAAYVRGSSSATNIFAAPGQAIPASQIYQGINIDRGNQSVYSPENGYADTRDRGGTLRVDYDLDRVGTLSSLTSYTYSSQPRTDVFFGLPRQGLTINITDFNAVTDLRTKYFTQEVRLASPSKGPFTYLIGAIYTSTRIQQPYVRDQIFPVNWDQGFTVDSPALYGRATYELTRNDSLTAGLRYQHDKIGYTWLFTRINPGDPNTFSSGSSGYGFFGGEASYKHRFGEDIQAYVTYSRSQTGKAYDLQDNGTAAVGTLQPIASEHVGNWEVGFKSQFFDRRLTFNIDAFWAKYSNYQIQTTINGTLTQAPTTRLLAIGKVRSRGVEVDSSFAVTPDFRLNFNGAYIDSTLTDFPNAACYSYQTAAQGCLPVAGGGTSQGNLAGLTLPFSPKWKFNVGADYTLPLAHFGLNMGAFYRYQSSQHFDVLGDPLTNEKGYGVLNLYIGPKAQDGRWSAQLFVNNLLNRHYYALLGNTSFWSTPLVNAYYDRNSFRYAGIRLSGKF